MKLELKNIRLVKQLSEETPCYTASLWLDGAKVAEVANRGHGGGDEVRWMVLAAEKQVTDYFAGLPAEEHQGYQLQPDLEMWCHDKVWDYEMLKDVRKDLRRKVILLTAENKEIAFKTLKPEALTDTNIVRQINERYPGATILNLLSDAELVARLKQLRPT